MTEKWELLTWCNDPAPEPENPDANLRPPHGDECPPINHKYGIVETIDCLPFAGTIEKMQYCRPDGRDVHRAR